MLFQVRPLAMSSDGVRRTPTAPRSRNAASQLRRLSRGRPPALGPRGVLRRDAGLEPRRDDRRAAAAAGAVALPLPDNATTSGRRAASRYGYRDLRGVPLLVDFCGLPVHRRARASFSSFVPADFDDAAAERLVAHYVSALRAQPHLHDKIESAIALTAYDFDAPGEPPGPRSSRACLAGRGGRARRCAARADLRMMARRRPVRARPRDRRERSRTCAPDGAAGGRRCGGSPRSWTTAASSARCRSPASRAPRSWRSGSSTASCARRSSRRARAPRSSAAPTTSRRTCGATSRRSTATASSTATATCTGTYDIRSARYDESFERYFDWSRRVEAGAAQAR